MAAFQRNKNTVTQYRHILRAVKQIAAPVLLAMLVLLLGGCSQAPEEPPPVHTEVIRELNIPVSPSTTLCSLGPERLAVAVTDYTSDRTELAIYNLSRDKTERTLTYPAACTLVSTVSDSCQLVLLDHIRSTLTVMDDSLSIRSTVTTPVSRGYLSADRETWFYLDDGILFAQSLLTGNLTPLPVPGNLGVQYLCGIDSQSDALTVKVYTNPFQGDTCTAVLDWRENRFLYYSGSYSVPLVQDGLIYLSSGGRASWGALGKSELTLSQLDISKIGVPPTTPSLWSGGWLTAISGSSARAGNTYLYRIGDSFSQWQLNDCGLPENTRIVTQSPQGQWLAGLWTEETAAKIYVVDLLSLEDGVNTAPEKQYRLSALERFALSSSRGHVGWGDVQESYRAARLRADILEDRYGITLLLGVQAADIQGMTLIPFRTDNGSQSNVLWALEELDSALSLYPGDYFTQLKKQRREGLIVALTGSMDTQYDAVGFEEQFRDCYFIALDISKGAETLGGTFCHEMWHCTEDFALATQRGIELQKAWDACNPPGFTYSSNHAEKIHTRYAFLSGSKNIYFADDYSCTFPTEDRARIMEYAIWYPEYFEIMVQSPPIRKKITILNQLISASFDTSGWESPPWAQWVK